MDGTIYAAVSSNLSQGNGSWWDLKFSETLLNPFYEHPPLAIWMESIVHRICQDSPLSERFYALIMWLIQAFLITRIWKQIKPDSKLQWVPLFLWMFTPIVIWSHANNMLETTMGVFVSGSVFAFFKGRESSKWFWNLISGGLLVLAFMSKGFVGLYPFALPFLYVFFFWKERNLKLHVMSFALMLVGFGILFLPFVLNQDGWKFLQFYFSNQVQKSVETVQTVPYRFKIVEFFIQQLLIPLSLVLITFGIYRKKRQFEFSNGNWFKLFITLALCGVLPIMISLKQREFYILTVYPFMVIGFALLFENSLEYVKDWITGKISKPGKIALIISIMAVILGVFSSSKYKREKEMVMGAEQLAHSNYAGKTLDCSNDIRYDWSTMAYLSRYAKISVWRGADSQNSIVFTREDWPGEVAKFEGLKLVERLIINSASNNNIP